MGPGQREADPFAVRRATFPLLESDALSAADSRRQDSSPRLDTHFSLAFGGQPRLAVRRPLKMIDYLTLDWSDVILGVFMAQLLVLALFADIKGR